MPSRRRYHAQHGFTLVEVLVVIVILGILAAIVVFSVTGITDKGDGSAQSADVRALEVAEEAHLANAATGVYASEADLLTKKFLRSASTKNSVCLNAVDDTSYEI